MDPKTLTGVIILAAIIIVFIIFKILKSNTKINDLLEKIDAADVDILDILDELMSNIEKVSEFDDFKDYKKYLLDNAIEKSIKYISDNCSEYGIPESLIKYITSDIMRDKIEKIISEYKYDNDMKVIYNKFKELESGEIDEESILKEDNSIDITDSIDSFYDNTDEFDV